MKENVEFSLNNRPHRANYPSDEHGLVQFAVDSSEWSEGFERRQRQNLADYKKALATRKNWDKEFLACWKAISNYITLEVLGVEPKVKEEIEK